MTNPNRRHRITAPFQYIGGKGMLLRHILPWVQYGKVYVEPFVGAAAAF